MTSAARMEPREVGHQAVAVIAQREQQLVGPREQLPRAGAQLFHRIVGGGARLVVEVVVHVVPPAWTAGRADSRGSAFFRRIEQVAISFLLRRQRGGFCGPCVQSGESARRLWCGFGHERLARA